MSPAYSAAAAAQAETAKPSLDGRPPFPRNIRMIAGLRHMNPYIQIKTALCRAAGKDTMHDAEARFPSAQPSAFICTCSAFLPPKNRNNNEKGRSPGSRIIASPAFPSRLQTVASQELLRIYSGGTAPDLHRASLLSRLHTKNRLTYLLQDSACFYGHPHLFQSLLNFNIHKQSY